MLRNNGILLQLGEYRLVPDAPGVNAGALVPIVSAASLGFLALLGAIGARAGGANVLRATARVRFWGALAMALIAGIGNFSGTVV
jgi:VIT1/CCC1 family predicted Fe2+/Mn2+ transporter